MIRSLIFLLFPAIILLIFCQSAQAETSPDADKEFDQILALDIVE